MQEKGTDTFSTGLPGLEGKRRVKVKINGKKCLNCGLNQCCKDSFISWLFFSIGIISAFSIRAVTVLTHVGEAYSKASWYVGVVGFSLFFIYKFKVLRVRARLIKNYNLIAALNDSGPFTENQSKLMREILCSITSRKERINYFFIFALSALAIAVAVYLDFLR